MPFLPVPELWVPRPCGFCKGGYDAAGTMSFIMPSGLHRSYGAHHLHFITCSCYRRLPFLRTARSRDCFLSILEQTRARYRFVVVGYVVMPEHIRLLITEPDVGTPSTVMQVLKQRTARAHAAEDAARTDDDAAHDAEVLRDFVTRQFKSGGDE